MSQTRVSEQGVEQRRARISNMKSQMAMVKEIGGLKGYPAWIPMKLILENYIKNQDKMIEAYLDTDNEKDSFIEARKARAVKLAMSAFYNFVENNTESVNNLISELTKAEEELKVIEDGEMV